MRYRLQAWWCGFCKTRNEGATRLCAFCRTSRIEKHAQVHASERAVVYVHPLTGERKTPPRADQPMPDIYARQGFERREILNMGAYEKETGVVHEASNYSPGNEVTAFREPERPPTPPAVRDALVRDLQEAYASGPWTESSDSKTFTVPVP